MKALSMVWLSYAQVATMATVSSILSQPLLKESASLSQTQLRRSLWVASAASVRRTETQIITMLSIATGLESHPFKSSLSQWMREQGWWCQIYGIALTVNLESLWRIRVGSPPPTKKPPKTRVRTSGSSKNMKIKRSRCITRLNIRMSQPLSRSIWKPARLHIRIVLWWALIMRTVA